MRRSAGLYEQFLRRVATTDLLTIGLRPYSPRPQSAMNQRNTGPFVVAGLTVINL